MQVYQPIMSFLPTALDNMSNFENVTFYNEEVIIYTLDLLSQSIDRNKNNQEFILKNFKIFDVLMLLINQNEYLDVAGKSCLVLSNMLWNNQKA